MVDESLRQRVEDLATRLVLGDTDATLWTTLLANVREEAETRGHPNVAQLATQAIEQLAGPGRHTGGHEINDEQAFCTSIIRLQNACMRDAPEQPTEPAAAAAAAAARPDPTPTSATFSLGDDPEMIGDFVLESREHLTQVEIQMMTLEKDPDDAEAINTVFRGFHTIKGLAGFLDLTDIREVAHETETLLDLVRNQELRITSTIVDAVLGAADFLKMWVSRLESTLAGAAAGPVPEKESILLYVRTVTSGGAEGSGSTPPPVETPAVETPKPAPTAKTPDPASPVIAAELEAVPLARGNEALRIESAPAIHGLPQSASSAVKVDTGKLDSLVDLAGEMVIAQLMVSHHPELAELKSPALLRSLAQLARITGELQKTAMSMRMVPVGGLFQKMNRLVRDLGRKTGKEAELEALGADTELDRNVVEELADPLMHMVRNSMDHGLEPPEERRAAGKNPQGRVRLRASHQGGNVVIEVGDDGRGLVREKILAKARRTGLVEDGSGLSDSEVFSFIFHPGFSTAAQITDVSGRGVGMDVVKRQIQKLRGRIDIESVPGQGTSFFLRLPLTLAMIDGLVVGVGKERYVLPISSVREVLQPAAAMMFTVEGRQEMALVRENLLPVVRLSQRLGVIATSEVATDGLLVVAEADGRAFCLLVDTLIGKQEVVIKSLGETLKNTPGVAGGAILGDGRVCLILDLERIFRLGVQ